MTDPLSRNFGLTEVKISKDKKEENYQGNIKSINGIGSNANNAEFVFKSLFGVSKATSSSRQ